MADNSSVFRPIAPPQNLAEELVSGLTEEITAGKLVPGERLPTGARNDPPLRRQSHRAGRRLTFSH